MIRYIKYRRALKRYEKSVDFLNNHVRIIDALKRHLTERQFEVANMSAQHLAKESDKLWDEVLELSPKRNKR